MVHVEVVKQFVCCIFFIMLHRKTGLSYIYLMVMLFLVA